MNDYEYRSFNLLKRLKLVYLAKIALIVKDNGIKGTIKKLQKRHEWKKDIKIDQSIYEDIKFDIGSINIVLDKSVSADDIINKLKGLSYKYTLFKLSNNPKKNKKYNEITEKFLKDNFLYRSFILITDNKKISKDFYYCFTVDKNADIVKSISNLLNEINGLKLIANYNNTENISVKAATFFNEKGTNYYSGGAERYLVDLHGVCKDLGFNMDIYQNSIFPYMRKFQGINVIGLSDKNLPMNYTMEYLKAQSRHYADSVKYSSLLHIYSAFSEGYPNFKSPSIGISHGIAWDNKSCIKTNGMDFWKRNEQIIESACLCDKLVSVDTNTANWFQTIDFQLGNQKIKVIPNYVDMEQFKLQKPIKRDKIVITYPRRLYEPRGMYLLLDIVDDLFKNHDNIEIHFVGKGFDEDVKKIKEKIKKYPDRLFCYSETPDKMHEVYKRTDISLIPTLYSEGTSLSCLEAMATGNIVVATRIGGLTDLIINGYNGYLVEPTKEDLLNTIENIIENIDEQDIIRKRARECAEVFNKKRWENSWKKVINQFNIKGSSSNIDLVEFYLESVNNIPSNIIELIKTELLNNKLIYIRSKQPCKKDAISGGLLQLVPWDEEVVSTAQKIYVQDKVKDLVDRKEEKTIIN